MSKGMSVVRSVGCSLRAIQIVPIEGNVQFPDWQLPAFDLLELGCETPGEVHATRANTDQGNIVHAMVFLDDLMRHAGERARDLLGLHDGRPAFFTSMAV